MDIFKRRKRDPVDAKQLKNINKRLTSVESRLNYLEKSVQVIRRET